LPEGEKCELPDPSARRSDKTEASERGLHVPIQGFVVPILLDPAFRFLRHRLGQYPLDGVGE